MKALDLDSPFMRFMYLLTDAVLIGGLWLVTSLGVITVGASTTAAYSAMIRRISKRGSGVIHDYFKAFKTNFTTATLVFLTLAVFMVIICINIVHIEYYGAFQAAALPVNIALFAETVFTSVYAFPILSRFDMKYKTLVKSAFLMANRHMATTIIHVILLAVAVFASMLYPFLILFVFGIYCLLSSYLQLRVFKKYRPDMDTL